MPVAAPDIKKPAFDPNQKFEKVNNKPAFDPSAKFETVSDKTSTTSETPAPKNDIKSQMLNFDVSKLNKNNPPTSEVQPTNLHSDQPASIIPDSETIKIKNDETGNRLLKNVSPHIDKTLSALNDNQADRDYKQIVEKHKKGEISQEDFNKATAAYTADVMVNRGQRLKESQDKFNTDPDFQKHVIQHIADNNPKISKQIQADAYVQSAMNRPQNASAVIKNSRDIEGGDLSFNIRNQQLTKNEDFAHSVSSAYENRNKTLAAYDAYTSGNEEDAIKNLEDKRINVNPDDPTSNPTGLGATIGGQGMLLAKGAGAAGLTSLIPGVGEALAPWAAGAATSPEVYKTSYATSLENNYNQLRNSGAEPQDAYKTAKDRAEFDAKADVASNIAATVVGAKIGLKAFKPKELSPGFISIAKNIANHVGQTTAEGGGVAAVAGGAEALKNIHSNRPAGENVLDVAQGQLMFAYGMAGLTHAASAFVKPGTRKVILQNVAKAPDETINNTLHTLVTHGKLSPEEATDIHTEIQTQKETDSKIPDNVKSDNARAQIAKMLERRDELEIRIENQSKAFHPELKEKIKALDEKITETANAGKQHDENPEIELPFKKSEEKPSVSEPSHEQQLEDIKNGRFATFTYEKDSDVPDIFKDKISSRGETNGKKMIRVTVPQSLADYYLSKGENTHPEIVPLKTEEKPISNFTDANTINEGYRNIKSKIGERKAKQYFEQADKLINPNQNTIVEYRPNGIITKEGDKYIFNALAGMDTKNWRIAFKNDVSDQFSHLKTETDALPEQSPSSVLQHTQEPTGETGGERIGMESGKQGDETTGTQGEESQTEGQEGAKLNVEKESADKAISGESDDVTSIKNAVTQLRRSEYGLGEEIPAAEKEFGTTWNQAKERIDEGYDPKDLVTSLKAKPRPLTDVENATLLHYQNTKELELTKANENINKAFDSGNEGDLAENRIRRLRVLDELQDIYDVSKAAGTENARGLVSRKMMTDRRYNLANMVSEKRAANGGKPLSDEQINEITKQHEAITKANKDLQDEVDRLKAENMQLKSEAPKTRNQTIKEKGKNLADKIRKLKKPKGGLSADFTLGTWDIAVEGVAQLVEKGFTVADAINKLIEENQIKFKAQKDRESFERILNQQDPDMRLETFANPEIFRLKAIAERAKESYEQGLLRDEAAKNTPITKAGNIFVKWQRAFKLSNPLTMGKLVAAATTRAITDPLEQVIGGGWSALLPKIAKGAIGEGGGLNVKEQAKAMTSGFMKGMKDAADIMRRGSSGKSDLDLVLGKGGHLAPEAIDFFGQLHSATKAPIKRAIFERSLAKRFRRSIAHGDDVSDPMVQATIAVGAYKDSNRAIFMQDNILSKAYQSGIKSLENSKDHPISGKFAARSLEWLIPFVKVPTNIAGEIANNVAGLPIAGAKILHTVFSKGIENLSADESDMIFRNLKKGSVGAGAMLLGYYNPQIFGGYHQEKEHRNAGDAKANTLKIGGVTIPAWLIESPIFQTMQFGATIRRVKDAKVHGEENGLSEGMWAAALGLPQKVPLIDQPYRITKTFVDPKERKYYFGELAKSTIDPAILSYIAATTDPADKKSVPEKILNPENKRRPTDVLEHIKTGIPGLRETVPTTSNNEKKTTWSK